MTDLEPPDFTALGRAAALGWGARYALRGARLVITHPSTWGYVLAPIALVGSAFLFGSGFLWWFVGWVTSFLWSPGPDTGAVAVVLYVLALWAVRLSLVGALLVTTYLLAGIVATPFNDRLSDHVERTIVGSRSDPWLLDRFLVDLFWSVTHSLLSLSIYLAAMSVLLLVNLIPGVGNAVSVVVGALVSAAFFAREAMDGSFSRRRLGYLEKWRIVARHWPLTLGFGLVVAGAMWLPLLNFVVLPMSVVGGTLLFCHLERAGLVPAPPEA